MGQRAIITVPLRWSFWGILVKYDSLRLSIVAWERPFLMNFDDRMGECRDKGRMWGRVGAWCLSWWQRDPVGDFVEQPGRTPTRTSTRPPHPLHPAPCPYRTLGRKHLNGDDSPIRSSTFIRAGPCCC